MTYLAARRCGDGVQPDLQFPPIVKLGPVVLQFQFSRTHQATKTGGEPLAKVSPQCDVVRQVRFLAVAFGWMPSHHPPAAIQRGASARNDGMNVRMETQLLVSRVEHHHGRRLKLAFPSQGFCQRPPGTME